MAGKFEPASVNDLVEGVVGNAARFKRNMRSIFDKYDREVPDDDLIDLSSMTIVQPGNSGNGVIKKSKPRIFGASRLQTTRRKETLLKSRLNSQPCEFNPNVSMAIVRECKSVMKASRDLYQEPSDAETLSSHDEEDDEDVDDSEDDLEGSTGDVSSEEEEDNEGMSFGGKDFESLYNHSLGYLKTKESECGNENEGPISDSDIERKNLLGGETYDADEEDFAISEAEKETPVCGRKFKGNNESPRIGRKVQSATANGNASLVASNMNAGKKDASPDDSFVSISSSTYRSQSQRMSGLNLTSSPSKLKQSGNGTFIVFGGSVASSAHKDTHRLDLEKPFVTSKNATQTSTSLSLSGFDSSFKSPQRPAVKRIPVSLMKKPKASTIVGSEKHVLNNTSLKADSHNYEDSQKSLPSVEVANYDTSCFQDVTNTSYSKSCIGNIPALSQADHDYTSKAIQVGSPIPIEGLRGKSSSSSEESRKDTGETNDVNFDGKRGDGICVEFSSDSDECENEMIDINRILLDSPMKKKREKDFMLHALKPSKTILETGYPQGQSGYTKRFSDGSNMAGRSANCGTDIEAHRERGRRAVYTAFIDNRSPNAIGQDTSNFVKNQLMAKQQDYAPGSFSPPERILPRQQSTSRTSGYQTDFSSIPVTQELDEELAHNVTYSVESGEWTDKCTEQSPYMPYESPKATKTDVCDLTFQINAPPSKTFSYQTDMSKLELIPHKPVKFDQEKLRMARKRYKPPEHREFKPYFQYDSTTFSKQLLPNIQDKETDNRVSQWVKNITENQLESPYHFPSCPPKIPSNFFTCISPHLAHMQVGTDHEYERHPVHSVYQLNESQDVLRKGHSQNSDTSDSWKSPPSKVRKLNSHSESNTESVSAMKDFQRPTSNSKTKAGPLMNRCSFYYSGKCRLETSSSRDDNDHSQCEEDLGNSFSKDGNFSHEIHNRALTGANISNTDKHQLNKSSRSLTSECKSSHFLSMNDDEFVHRVSSNIVQNIKKYLNLDSFMQPINRNNNCETAPTYGPLKISMMNQPTVVNSESQKCMFPEEYVNMFSPSNPNRIDSDEAVRIEQEVASSSLDFKQCLRSFRPRRHQKGNSQPKIPTDMAGNTGIKTITKSPPKDPTPSDDVLSGNICSTETVKETFEFKKPLHSLSQWKRRLAASTENKAPKEMAKRDLSLLKPFKPTPAFRSSTPKPFHMMSHTDCPNSSISTIVAPSTCGPLETDETENIEPISLNGSFDAFEDEDEDQDISLVD